METRTCQNCKNDFNIEPEDFDFYSKMKVPPPTFCAECRMVRRFNFRNEKILFRRKDAHTGEEIFSGFSPDTKVITYENDYWFGGDWDPLATGVDYNFNINFFDQLRELLARAPLPARSVINMVNSEYCNEASECKNSYLCFNTDYAENSAYLYKSIRNIDTFDMYDVNENELCYQGVIVDKCYRTLFSLDCESCVDVWFSRGLRGCTNCFGCVNLSKKSYCIFNVQYSKEDYEEKIKEYDLDSYKTLQSVKEKVANFWIKFPVKYNHSQRNVNSSGERINDSKNVKDSYAVLGGENLRYSQQTYPGIKDSYDFTIAWEGAENVYESIICGIGAYNLKFCCNSWENIRELEYCFYCVGSKNCFGCIGLYKKEYCIFNKQYSKEEYFDLVEKIKKQMDNMPYVDSNGRIYKYGEFFPFDMSPNAYNESLANDFFPLTKEQALEKGYLWRDTNLREYETTVKSADLPDSINDVTENITSEIIECADCKRAYRIIELELNYYKKMKIPLPRICHNCRFTERFKLVNPPELWPGRCMCSQENHGHAGNCSNEFETSYAPDRPEIIYCESCYNKEVN